nr:dna repair protein crb2 [Quercus suber]
MHVEVPLTVRSALGRHRSWAFWLMRQTLGRSTEFGSRTLVHAGNAGMETHKRFLRDCEVTQDAPFVRSAEGRALQDRVWKELAHKLELVKPGIASLEYLQVSCHEPRKSRSATTLTGWNGTDFACSILQRLTQASLQPCELSVSNRHAPPKTASALLRQSHHNATERVMRDGTSLDTLPRKADLTHVSAPDVSSTITAKRPPRLRPARTAPTPIMDVTVSQSPSQGGIRTMTRAESLPGYPGGDTQPMDTQVYRDYTRSMINISLDETPIKAGVDHDDKLSVRTGVLERSPHTYTEGDPGFVDLGLEWQPASPTTRSQGSVDMDELLEHSPQSQSQLPDWLPKSAMPETPSIAGNKHDRDGNVLTSEPTTSKKMLAFSQLFGGGASKGPMLSATQLFNQTQAPSSPVTGAPRSDPVVSRPSPNMGHNLSLSSPPAPTTSPFTTVPRRLSISEKRPRDTYASVRKSQRRELNQLRQKSSIPECEDEWEGEIEEVDEKNGSDDDDDDDDEDQDRVVRGYGRQRARELLSKQAQSDWARIRAPSRDGLKPTSNRKAVARTTIDLVTPARHAQIGFEMPSSDGTFGPDMAVAEYTDLGHEQHVASGREISSAGSSHGNDVYDELGQTVLRHQASDEHEELRSSHDQADVDMGGPGCEEDEIIPRNSNTSEEVVSKFVPERPAKASFNRMNTQGLAVADSQTDRQILQRSSLTRHLSVPSPRSSYLVPGSQYTGKTNEEQTHFSSQKKKAGEDHSAPNGILTVPSSPPVPVAESSLPEGSPFPHREPSLNGSRHVQKMTTQQEIPESDLPDSAEANPELDPVGFPTNVGLQAESHSIAPFSTARTHVSSIALSQTNDASLKSPAKVLASQPDEAYSPSPRRAAGVRHFADIRDAKASQPHGSVEAEIDLDGLLGDVITTEDVQVMKALSGPRCEHMQKRRKLTPEALFEQTLADNAHRAILAQPLSSSNDAGETAEVADKREARERNVSEPEASRSTIIQAPSADIQSSPSKVDEAPLSTPAAAKTLPGTQDSVKKREAAGANAVSQLLSSSRAKTLRDSASATQSGRVRKSRSVNVKSSLKERRSKKGTSTSKSTARSRMTIDPPMQSKQSERVPHARQDVSVTDVSIREAAGAQQSGAPAPCLEMIAPNRIFAFFRGRDVKYNNYYPATWLGVAADGKTFKVRFDDGTVTNVQPDQVCSLALHVGDSVRELHFDGHVQACVVQGFGPIAQTDEDRALGTDQYGRTMVHVRAKPAGGRISTPASSIASVEQNGKQDVMLTNIYLTRNMWPHFRDRAFMPPQSNKADEDRAGTPVTAIRSSEAATPTSRVRRSGAGAGNVVGISRLREGSATSMSSRSTGALFASMAFALSFSTNDDEKKSITHQIQRNGGIILEDEFDALFDIHDCEGPINTTPKKVARAERDQSPPAATVLRLKPHFQTLGFVALITDSHSRRAKYIQALSLGLPTISGRWIHDSVSPAKNPSLHSGEATTLDWAKYLLPAGESSYLGNVVRSRTIPIYPAATAKLADTIANRDVLLGGSGVLLVVPKKGAGNKALWQRHKPFAFLTLALGAGAVQRIDDLAEAEALLREDPDLWKWVYVDGDVATANWQLSGKKGGKPKTRSKADPVSCARSNGVTVVGDEFVIQSLILGALVD